MPATRLRATEQQMAQRASVNSLRKRQQACEFWYELEPKH